MIYHVTTTEHVTDVLTLFVTKWNFRFKIKLQFHVYTTWPFACDMFWVAEFETMNERVYTRTKQISNTCDCSSSLPIDDVMIFQGPPIALHVHDKRLYNVPWTMTIEDVIYDICNVIQFRLLVLIMGSWAWLKIQPEGLAFGVKTPSA